MNKKNLLIILTALILSPSMMISSAWAGNVQRNRWEGVAIGLGAAILGTALIHQFRHSDPEPPIVEKYRPPTRHHGHRYRQKPSGHWEIRKVWVQPIYEKVWNPAHYDRHGRWIPGQWIYIEKEPGYWTEEKIWVSMY